MLHLLENVNPTLVFETRSGDLAVTQQGEGYLMDFPLNPPTQEVQYVIRKHAKTSQGQAIIAKRTRISYPRSIQSRNFMKGQHCKFLLSPEELTT